MKSMKGMKEKDVLINRSQMLRIAREYNIFVSKSTIHQWANEPDFPLVVGQDGRCLLYSQFEWHCQIFCVSSFFLVSDISLHTDTIVSV